jgi:hypothetical protein
VAGSIKYFGLRQKLALLGFDKSCGAKTCGQLMPIDGSFQGIHKVQGQIGELVEVLPGDAFKEGPLRIARDRELKRVTR